MRGILIAAVAAVGAIFIMALIATMFGHSPAVFLKTLIEGSVGSTFALRGTLSKSVPLLLTGLAVVVAFRAGVWNIGGEGQVIVGGLAAMLGAQYGAIAAILCGAIAGAAWASIASVMRIWREAPEVLTTILLNFIAIHLLGWAVNGPLQEAGGRYPQSDRVAATFHYGFILAVTAAVFCWWILYRTNEGLRLRATGFNPNAARYAGINVNAQIVRAMAISGALAGAAGAIELLGVTHRLFERFASGYGYAGIAVALLSQLHPLASILSAMFFGALNTGAGELQRSAAISSSVATLGQAVVILLIIGFSQVMEASGLGPRASGERRPSVPRGLRPEA